MWDQVEFSWIFFLHFQIKGSKMDAMFTDPTDLELFRVALLLIVFNILLPSFDVYSDLAFSSSLIRGTYKPSCEKWTPGYPNCKPTKHPIFGTMMLIPIILATLFIIPHWLKRENTALKRILTFPIVVCQFWPQLQVIKVLKLMKERRTKKWREEKEKLEKEVSSLGNDFLLFNYCR